MTMRAVGTLCIVLFALCPCTGLALPQTNCPAATESEAHLLMLKVEDLAQSGKWEDAIPVSYCLVEISKKVFGPEHLTTVNLQFEYAAILRKAGRPEDAAAIEKQLQKSGSPEKEQVPDEIIAEINQLIVQGKCFYDRGDYESAGEAYVIGKSSLESKKLTHNIYYAIILNECGRVYEQFNNLEMAEKRYQESAKLAKEIEGPESFQRAVALNNLGLLYNRTSRYQLAEETLKEVINVYGEHNPESIESTLNLGGVYEYTSRHGLAREKYIAARDLIVKFYGDNSHYLMYAYEHIAAQAWRSGRMDEAIIWQEKLNLSAEHTMKNILSLGSEEQKSTYLSTLTGRASASVSLGKDAGFTPRAVRMAFNAVLQQKGRVLDVLADSYGFLRRSISIEDRGMFDKWREINTKYATLSLQRPDKMNNQQYRTELVELQRDKSYLEDKISQRSVAFRAQSAPLTIERMQQAIPDDAVLVELFRYEPFNLKAKGKELRWGAPRYIAFILKNKGSPVAVDLGEAESIDKRVSDLLVAFRDVAKTYGNTVARDLYRRLVLPLKPYIFDMNRILVSPDGPLNLLPFGALIDDDKQYLVKSIHITYLPSSRDLVRTEESVASSNGPVVIADPDFGPSGDKSFSVAPSPDNRLSGELTQRHISFSSLAGTALEAQALKEILKLDENQVLVKAKATETSLKKLRGPRILHIATHGFFFQRPTQRKQQRAKSFGILPRKPSSSLRCCSGRGKSAQFGSGRWDSDSSGGGGFGFDRYGVGSPVCLRYRRRRNSKWRGGLRTAACAGIGWRADSDHEFMEGV